MQKPRMSMPDEKSQFIPASDKEYIDKLKKEQVKLMKLLVDRNKIFELCGNELYKQRVSVQKQRKLNLQLAQSNSQMLAELKAEKERLKMLNHELGCKNALLTAKGLELKVKMHDEKLDFSHCFPETEEAECRKTEEPEPVVRISNRDRKVPSKLADFILQK